MFNAIRRFMISIALLPWMVWQRLRHPTTRAIYYRVHRSQAVFRGQWWFVWVVVCVFAVLFCIDGLQRLNFAPPMPVLMLVFMSLFSTLYLVPWIFEISTAMYREYNRETYDLLCVLPAGAAGVDLAISAACLHRNDLLRWTDFVRLGLSGLILFVFLIILVPILFTLPNSEFSEFLHLLIEMSALVMISYLEHVQSILMGVMLAMLLSHMSRTQTNTNFQGVVVFIGIQAVSLLLVLLLTQWLAHQSDTGSPIVASLVLFFALRHALIIFLWSHLSSYWNVDLSDQRPSFMPV